jgi:hypothetical protein
MNCVLLTHSSWCVCGQSTCAPHFRVSPNWERRKKRDRAKYAYKQNCLVIQALCLLENEEEYLQKRVVVPESEVTLEGSS